MTRSYVDQLVRADDIDTKTLKHVTTLIDRAERLRQGGQEQAASSLLRALANQLKGEQYDDLRAALLALADA